MADRELGREYVRARVRTLLGDTSNQDWISGPQRDYLVTFTYSDPDLSRAETYIKVELPNHFDFQLRLEQRARKRRDTFAIHGFTGTVVPVAVAQFLIDKTLCEQLVEQRIRYVRIAPFDPKEHLSRRTVRQLEYLSDEEQADYRSKYTVSLTVRGWIENPDDAVASIALAVDLASRVPDAITRAAGADLAAGPYRDAPAEGQHAVVDARRSRVRRLVAAAYGPLARVVAHLWPF